jgi:hypothetical protein
MERQRGAEPQRRVVGCDRGSDIFGVHGCQSKLTKRPLSTQTDITRSQNERYPVPRVYADGSRWRGNQTHASTRMQVSGPWRHPARISPPRDSWFSDVSSPKGSSGLTVPNRESASRQLPRWPRQRELVVAFPAGYVARRKRGLLGGCEARRLSLSAASDAHTELARLAAPALVLAATTSRRIDLHGRVSVDLGKCPDRQRLRDKARVWDSYAFGPTSEPLRSVQDRLSEIVDRVEREHDRAEGVGGIGAPSVRLLFVRLSFRLVSVLRSF